MNNPMVWTGWILLTLGSAAFLAWGLSEADRRGIFLPGETTAGHYQIEIGCETCHTPFGGVSQDVCLDCHSAELDFGEDSHPKSKFTDPRNADRIATLDATRCVTCHVEHRPEITNSMAVTLPTDFCAHCHGDVAVERPSHEGMAFDTCASAGCHNFHDNRALYEDFLVRNIDVPELLSPARVLERRHRASDGTGLSPGDGDAPQGLDVDPAIVREWSASAHAVESVNCSGCHVVDAASGWIDVPGLEACAGCHSGEAGGFLAGRHGMRLDAGLSPMSPSMSRLPMRAEAVGRELGCSSCHGPHDTDTRFASAGACLGCHADTHSQAWEASPHAALWATETGGIGEPASGVSCATCHLPRESVREGGESVIRVQHNQNWNLRPNEKMLREVCMTCHGLEFSIDALADPSLIQTNFAGRPAIHVDSIDMIRRRILQQRN